MLANATEALNSPSAWPALVYADWQATAETVHLWTQIVGKIRMALTPHINHWWEVPLYVTAHGLTTSPIPWKAGIFEIRFDFAVHKLQILTSEDEVCTLPLGAHSVADFYSELMQELHSLGIDVKIWPMPVEIPNPIRCDEDRVHDSYDPEAMLRFWRVLAKVDAIFKEFRAAFLGKASPVHFFWGSFDLAVTRFSGRRAPERPGADAITREAYSHEVSSAGFWPGGGGFDAAFYSYAAPEPPGFREAKVLPATAAYNTQLGEFILPYEAMRQSSAPKAALMAFLQSTYEAAANLGNWDRASLDLSPPPFF